MSDLHHALGDITRIRRQVAASTQFRGYGPVTLASTGLAALVAARLQSIWVADPAHHLQGYLTVWIMTAVLASSVAGWQIHRRTRRLHSGLSHEMIRTAVSQFLPAVFTGLLLTVVLLRFVPAACWMLPGLWQIIYGLGVCASCRFLSKSMYGAGVWYLLTGLTTIALGDARALAPWTMGLSFGGGQFLIAAVLLLASPEEEDL